MEETISLKEILETLKKRIVMIIAITLAAVGISAAISFFVLTPIYETSTQILVNQSPTEQQTYSTSDIDTNRELINTYNVIIKSPTILESVREELGLERSYNSLNNQINVAAEGDSQVVSISVQDPDPVMAVNIANMTANVFERDIVNIMSVDNVSILSTAELTEEMSPVSPQPMLNMAIAFVVGLMAAVGLAFLLEFLDNTIKTEQDIERGLELPVLGVIPEMDANDQKAAKPYREEPGSEKVNAQKIS
ncbi:YveK family protein [Bacillus sp. FJAT-44742]|uniref:YveK family protein n=1 Tax=Bacillus sp. FJAT-44742 TaxID=2014005 RepID=UPI000C234349|nr:Wzz/FepE/Etk N-terminal domain-containing protein [Bacillus sp. FJAT-44742]